MRFYFINACALTIKLQENLVQVFLFGVLWLWGIVYRLVPYCLCCVYDDFIIEY